MPEKLTNNDEVDLDPLKITLHFSGMHGAEFHEQELYERFGIQTNKYSHNTVLALVTIGTTWSMADQLVRKLQDWRGTKEEAEIQGTIPTFTAFGSGFHGSVAGSGDLAKAYYDGLSEKSRVAELKATLGKISAGFVTPYPPGFPILVPGQVVSREFIEYVRFLRSVGVKQIHGMEQDNRLVIMSATGKRARSN